MSDTPLDADRERRLGDALAEYMRATERGETPDRGAFVAHYPDLADELQAYFANKDCLAEVAPPPAQAPTLVPDETAAPCPPLAAGRRLGDYEVLEEIARGGMGIVYKARQVSANRLVALKVIRADRLDDLPDAERQQWVARFRAEAEAVANLDHPGIVPLYEVGEHQGQPFFSMKLVEGGNLGEWIKEAQKSGRSAAAQREIARLLATAAQAVHSAHQRGILHRDLKPGNVLLDGNGHPLVTDFGLAKRLNQAGSIAPSSIVGTAAYMPPEQAAARRDAQSTAADVYGLGAILYEMLTGRPPFQGANDLDVLLQVLEREPTPPRVVVPGVNRDLETICLKCLRKEPRERYSSAQALADDLDNWRAGRPVTARPVGPLERGWKWVRRNPVVAGMAAVVVLALLGGAGVSTGFGIAWRQQAAVARENEANALARGRELATANENLARTAEDLTRSRNDLETTLARSLLRPLALQGGDRPMTDPEWEALWELARNRSGRLGYRSVEEACRTPATSRQLRDRASVALPAAVGLDEERRAEVEALLLARLDDPALSAEHKTDLVLALSAWDGLSGPAAARLLSRALADAKDPLLSGRLAERLSAVAGRLEARDGAAALVGAMKGTRDPNTLWSLERGLLLVAPRLGPGDAATTAAEIVAALARATKDTKDPATLGSLAQGLSAVAGRLEARGAAEAATTLVRAMKDTRDPGALQQLARGLSAVAPCLGPGDAAATAAPAATTIVRAMKDTKNPRALQQLAQGLSAVAGLLEARGAATTAAEAATTIVRAMKDNKDPRALHSLAQGLSLVAPRLGPGDAATTAAGAAAALVRAMRGTKDPRTLGSLARDLSGVAGLLEAGDAATTAVEAATILVRAMKGTKDPGTWASLATLASLAQSLSLVAPRLAPGDAATIAAEATATIVRASKGTRNHYALLTSLSVLGAWLEARDAAEAAAIVVQVMQDTDYMNNTPRASRPLALSALLSDDPPMKLPSRSATAASAVAFPAGTGHPLTGLAFLVPATEPPPRRLSTQQLVDLLKMPTCIGEARRLILDQLGNRYRRTFSDPWEFVRFAQEQEPGLDFTSPPQRPAGPGADEKK
jgi:tRNA A-37 threonylcarbamoyl transferase component Bud32